ncbi:MAG: glycosyltransferase family 4 protein [Candidatus Aminicenantes bacterium]|nr:glycosyltransferase family 4 protein [Candidatus Aminicenantes bacterium]
MPPKVLIITRLFAVPWNTNFAVYNQHQFALLAEHMEVSILVPISWVIFIKNPRAYWRFKRQARTRWPHADYFVFWHAPRFFQFSHPFFLLLSLICQRFSTLFLKRWNCLIGSWGFPDAITAVFLAKLTRTPVVVKVHGSDVHVFTHKRLLRVQMRWALNRAHTVIAVSKAMAARLAAIGVEPGRTKVLYNGVDALRFHPMNQYSARDEHGIGPDDEVILFVGILLASKGCNELLEAFANLAKKRPLAKLVFIGDGPLKKKLLARVDALGLVDRVHFLGWVEHCQLPSWFSAASVFCLPSYSEGVPNVVLEAMACGTPVVATAVGGVGEILPDFAGLLIPPHDEIALEIALDHALNSPWDHQRAMAHAAAFNWDKNVKILTEILAGAIQRAGSSEN